jgi:hypothetical protein
LLLPVDSGGLSEALVVSGSMAMTAMAFSFVPPA